MPEPKHINCVWIAQNLVNDAVGSVNDLADGGVAKLGNDPAHLGKVADGKSLIDKLVTEAARVLNTVGGDETDDLPQVIL